MYVIDKVFFNSYQRYEVWLYQKKLLTSNSFEFKRSQRSVEASQWSRS